MLETLPRSCSRSSVPGKLEEPIFRFFCLSGFRQFGRTPSSSNRSLFFFPLCWKAAVPSVAISIGSFLFILAPFLISTWEGTESLRTRFLTSRALVYFLACFTISFPVALLFFPVASHSWSHYHSCAGAYYSSSFSTCRDDRFLSSYCFCFDIVLTMNKLFHFEYRKKSASMPWQLRSVRWNSNTCFFGGFQYKRSTLVAVLLAVRSFFCTLPEGLTALPLFEAASL